MRDADVLVVGAGPVGLCLALALARAGRSVVVLEKEAGTSEHSRAPAIWPRTQEILAGLGVIDTFLAAGIVLRRGEMWDADRGRVLLRLPFAELADETDYPQLLVLPQSDTERFLADALAGASERRAALLDRGGGDRPGRGSGAGDGARRGRGGGAGGAVRRRLRRRPQHRARRPRRLLRRGDLPGSRGARRRRPHRGCRRGPGRARAGVPAGARRAAAWLSPSASTTSCGG